MEDAIRIQTAQNVSLAFAPAGVGERIVATLLDALMMTAYTVVAIRLGEAFPGAGAGLALTIVLPWLGYPLFFETLFQGQTPGKMVMRIKVARLDGAQPTLGQYLLRWLLWLVDVPFTSGVAAVVAVSATRDSQRLGDLAAGTTVVRRRRRLRLSDVRYPALPPGYAPTFAEAEHLTDAEVRTVRAVVARLNHLARGGDAERLGRRAVAAVEQRLGVANPGLPAKAFLLTVVRDHVALVDRHAPESGPVPGAAPDDRHAGAPEAAA